MVRAANVLAAIVLAAALATAAAAQSYRAPRTAYGAPDFDGSWTNNSLTSLERPEELKSLVVSDADAAAYEKTRLGKPPKLPEDTVGGSDSEWWETDVGLARIRGQRRSSWIVHPADGQIPFTAAAKAANKARSARRKVDFDHPEVRSADERCLLPAAAPPLLNGGYNDNFQLVQTKTQLAIVAEYMTDLRIVRIGAVSHPPRHIRGRGGDSIGRWEGETLVIETTNFTPAEVDAPDGDPGHDMRVVERITRTGPDELHYAFRVESPAVHAQSWNGEMVLRRLKARMFEFACHEGNYGLPNILSGGRTLDAAKAAPGPATASAAAP
jgi:hypothetical protein